MYLVSAQIPAENEYYTSTGATGYLEITKKPLTITAKNNTITYGAAPANDGVVYDGFVPGEDETKLSGTLEYDYTYEQFGNVGNSYKITPKDETVTDEKNNKFSFAMPDSDVSINTTFKKIEEEKDPNEGKDPTDTKDPDDNKSNNPFVDVNENDWFYDSVIKAYESGLMSGISNDTLAPQGDTTRAQVATMFTRLLNVK